MSRQFAKIIASLSLIAVGLFGGCQRPMGGGASGPFAPAGTLAPATSQPLIPFGPLNGATRVPPPPTGSTQASNGYSGPSAMSATMPTGNANSYDSFASATNPSLAAGSAPTNAPISANTRSNLGGIPVIDLTVGFNNGQGMAAPYGNQAVGSGVANIPAGMNTPQNNGWQTGYAQSAQTMPTPSISVPPSDLAARLRPLDTNVAAAAIPLQGQPGFAQPGPAAASVAMTQYRNEASMPSPAWQAVQPASATIAPQNPPYVSQLPTGPSTDPVTPPTANAGVNPGQNQSLLWRNPSSVR